MVTEARQGHAVVIGAGIAGLLAAHVLAGNFEHVTIVERDRLGPAPQARKGVPQGHHAHALQARGLQALEELLPGIQADLTAAGAPPIDFCRDGRLHLPHGFPCPQDSNIFIQPISRPLLETVVRTRVLAAKNILIHDGCQVTGLTADSTRSRITGIHIRPHPSRNRNAVSETLAGDLIADASGRNSHLPAWLTALGLSHVTQTTVDARIGYATRTYHTTTHIPWHALFELLHPPTTTRGAFALQTEDSQLIVTLQGAAGDHPPTDPRGFDAFMQSLTSDLYDTVRHQQPTTSAIRYARTSNRRLHYHRVKSWPQGLIVLGDAACAFNPVYAQGMTVATLQAIALRTLLQHHLGHRPTRLARQFQKQQARITTWPWLLATLTDRGWQDPPLPILTRAGLWYLGHWQRLAITDTRMHRDLARVTNMISSPLLLLHPRHITRVAATLLEQMDPDGTDDPAPPVNTRSRSRR